MGQILKKLRKSLITLSIRILNPPSIKAIIGTTTSPICLFVYLGHSYENIIPSFESLSPLKHVYSTLSKGSKHLQV